MTELSTTQKTIKSRFKMCEHPEHVEEGLREILALIQEEIEFEEDQWTEIFEELKDDVIYRDAEWLEVESE